MPTAEEEPPSLWDRRLVYIHRVLTDPTTCAELVDDPDVREKLRRGLIGSQKAIYLGAYGLERKAEPLSGGLDNPYRGYFGFFESQFKHRRRPRPDSIEAWRHFFTPVSWRE